MNLSSAKDVNVQRFFDNNDTSVSFQSNWTMNDIDDKPALMSVVSHMSLRKKMVA